MVRYLVAAALAVVIVLPAEGGKRAARAFTVVEKVSRSQAVVVGKVASIETESVMLPLYAGDPNKVAHKVAVIKVEKGLYGVGTAAEVKVAFVPPPKPDPNAPPIRGGGRGVDFPVGQEGVFFLTKAAGRDHYSASPLMPPLDPKADDYKALLQGVTQAAAALSDPMKSLKADKPEARYVAACTLATKYRSSPESGEETVVEKVSAEESQLILKGLAEGDWTKFDPALGSGLQPFYMLALTPKDGWVQPVIANTPGAPPVDFNAVMQDAFTKWIDGPGKGYQINKIVVKPTRN